MGSAAGNGAAGGQEALGAQCRTDPGTLARVAERLRGQISGHATPVTVDDGAVWPRSTLARRTATPLRHTGRAS